MAEDAARELPSLTLDEALQLVNLYAEEDSPKYERAALRWLERYLGEGDPRLKQFAEVALSLASRSDAREFLPSLVPGERSCLDALRDMSARFLLGSCL
jgi:hypothetical protein